MLTSRTAQATAIVIVGLTVGGYVAAPQLMLWHHLRIGRDALEHDRVSAAFAAFDAAEAWNGTDPALHFWQARAHRRAGEYPAAFDRLDRAEKGGFDQDRIRRERILAYARAGHIGRVVDDLPDLLQNAGDDGHEICEAFVTGHCLNMNFDGAEPLLDAWERDYPASASPLVFRGKIAAARERWAAAVAAYRAALKHDDQRYDAWLGVGQVLEKQSDFQAAERSFRRATTLRPEEPLAWLGLAKVLVAQEKTTEAKAAFRRVLELDPSDDEAKIELASVALSSGEPEDAVRHLDEVVTVWPDDIRANYLLAKALQSLGRTEASKEHFARSAAASREFSALHGLAEEVTRRPDDADLRYQVAQLFLRYESRKEGFSWLRSVLLYDPSHREAHQALADYYTRRGDRTSARMHELFASQ